MDSLQKRYIMFLFGCIPTRLALTWTAYKFPQFLPLLGKLAIVLAAGFITIFIMGWRKTGQETFGDRIWWNSLRPVHALLWALFAYMALTNSPDAWKLLLVDTLVGLNAFVVHHFLL